MNSAEKTNANRRVLLLHGWMNRRPQDHWQYWLAEELREARVPVAYPQMPDPDTPKLDVWLEILLCDLAMLGRGERIVICHSLSCMLWLHAADRRLIEGAADRVLFVAPPGVEAFTAACDSFAPITFNVQAVASSSRSAIELVSADDDPYCSGGAHARYAQALSFSSYRRPGGHFTPASGYGVWPEVRQWVFESTTFRNGAAVKEAQPQTEDR